jgi:hypothetical protein
MPRAICEDCGSLVEAELTHNGICAVGHYVHCGWGHELSPDDLISDGVATRIEELEAKLTWKPVETAPKDGHSILLLTRCHGVCEAWFEKGYWTADTPISPREYSGDAWVCCDNAFQIEVEFGPDGYESHGTATHWMPLPVAPAELKGETDE